MARQWGAVAPRAAAPHVPTGAVLDEGTKSSERAVPLERTWGGERAVGQESTKISERAEGYERSAEAERADLAESTVTEERLTLVDVGFVQYGPEVSLRPLIRRFKPDYVYGFDPLYTHPATIGSFEGTRALLAAQAAWTRDGVLTLSNPSGVIATAMHTSENFLHATAITVPCFDFVWWLRRQRGCLVVKLDVEGAEFPLLQALLNAGLDTRIGRLLVEWHERYLPSGYRAWRDRLETELRCPIEEWQ